MREAAYTTLGRNILSTGLVSHFSALIAGMMTVSWAEVFACTAYGFACLAFVAGAYVELKDRGHAPLMSLSFYGASAVAVVPVAGPAGALFVLYAAQGNRSTEPFILGGMLASIPRLKLNPLVLFLFLTVLFILFALTIMERDPYFKKANAGRVSFIGKQAGLALCMDECAPALSGPLTVSPGKRNVFETAKPI